MTEQELFLKSLKEGKIIILDKEETEEGTKYYCIQNLNKEELSFLEEILNEEIKSYIYSGYEITSEYIASIRSMIKKLGLKEISDYDKWGKYYE